MPAIFIHTASLGYTNEQERRYDMVYNFSDPRTGQQQGLEKAIELLQRPDLKSEWQAKRQKMLADMSDVTAFIVDVVERYARSSSG